MVKTLAYLGRASPSLVGLRRSNTVPATGAMEPVGISVEETGVKLGGQAWERGGHSNT